ncbi:hypothetical protein DMB66_23970 [Actinoplanes sp. ATCC 53533]|uniref:hypothetical protein n=1 Tax=Actinoplanes sp. ATCC 53533 TaxID=1288362 RepID=UPI000F7726D2|nr:hypothetical protein [Actinoplanes sp. ATCC 53533]RSM61760.1 hypothetical protein DMB66_23970 [Actinoplanes sp. ATCC 53533]
MFDATDTDAARLRRALERIVATTDALGDLTGIGGIAEVARRALASENIEPGPGSLGLGDLEADLSGSRPSYLLLSFIVTRDGERQHPMDVAVVRLNLDADGLPDEASMQDLGRRVADDARRKARQRRARPGQSRA